MGRRLPSGASPLRTHHHPLGHREDHEWDRLERLAAQATLSRLSQRSLGEVIVVGFTKDRRKGPQEGVGRRGPAEALGRRGPAEAPTEGAVRATVRSQPVSPYALWTAICTPEGMQVHRRLSK
jgi:hypothetical protein